ncbi:hypothetical protein FQN49_003547 [Arthroderma sp. PD_2]|nr:hypothetical protein FQN49_003547 [Arthroderma sp. PD_2]
MPSRSEIAYFGAGPAPLPTAEISHRSPAANQILADTKAGLTALLDIPENYEILFLQGGGTGEFSAVVQNLVSVWVERRRRKVAAQFGDDEARIVTELKRQVDEELKLDYLVTGSWSSKAAQEAKRLVGEKFVNVAVDPRAANGGKFGKIPAEEEWRLTKTKSEGGKSAPAFVYFCDNETVDGVEFPAFPKALENAQDVNEEDERLVVADMSSNFLSRKIDVKKEELRKILVRKDLLPPHTATPTPSLLRQLNIGGLPGPIVMDYAITAKNNSLYNTLPIFTLWIAGQVIASLVESHGEARVAGQEDIVKKKTALLYGALDKYPQVYQVVPDKSVRSRMNVCFRVHGGDAEKEKEFIAGAEKRLLQGLKGHRSVGGMRASNYNAVSLENVEKLVQYLNDFASA